MRANVQRCRHALDGCRDKLTRYRDWRPRRCLGTNVYRQRRAITNHCDQRPRRSLRANYGHRHAITDCRDQRPNIYRRRRTVADCREQRPRRCLSPTLHRHWDAAAKCRDHGPSSCLRAKIYREWSSILGRNCSVPADVDGPARTRAQEHCHRRPIDCRWNSGSANRTCLRLARRRGCRRAQ